MTAVLTFLAIVGGGLLALAFAGPLVAALWLRWNRWCDTMKPTAEADEIKTLRAEIARLRNELAERGGLR